MPARTDLYADDTQTPFSAPSPYGVTHDKLTSREPFATDRALLPCAFSLVCHLQATVQTLNKDWHLRIFSRHATLKRHNLIPLRFIALRRLAPGQSPRNRLPLEGWHRPTSDRASIGRFSGDAPLPTS